MIDLLNGLRKLHARVAGRDVPAAVSADIDRRLAQLVAEYEREFGPGSADELARRVMSQKTGEAPDGWWLDAGWPDA